MFYEIHDGNRLVIVIMIEHRADAYFTPASSS
ncbi:type II toxin-antitoxin system RelE family toxin [Actinomadura sp. HBU206391]